MFTRSMIGPLKYAIAHAAAKSMSAKITTCMRNNMYTLTNYKTKKALKADVAAGKRVTVYQPGGFFPGKTDGTVTLEGPHHPEPHKWYATAEIRDSVIVSVK